MWTIDSRVLCQKMHISKYEFGSVWVNSKLDTSFPFWISFFRLVKICYRYIRWQSFCMLNAHTIYLWWLLYLIVPSFALLYSKVIDTVLFFQDVWSSPYTWGGESPPREGDFIVVPKGQTLLIDQDTPILKMLLINGGTVIFDEKDLHLQTENILITDEGLLQVNHNCNFLRGFNHCSYQMLWCMKQSVL